MSWWNTVLKELGILNLISSAMNYWLSVEKFIRTGPCERACPNHRTISKNWIPPTQFCVGKSILKFKASKYCVSCYSHVDGRIFKLLVPIWPHLYCLSSYGFRFSNFSRFFDPIKGTTTFLPNWTDRPIEKYVLTEEGEKSETCVFMTMDEVEFTKIVWKRQDDYLKRATNNP